MIRRYQFPQQSCFQQTRNMKGAWKMSQHGQKLPIWMLSQHTLDGLHWWQFHAGMRKGAHGRWMPVLRCLGRSA